MEVLTTWEYLTSGNKLKVIIINSISVCACINGAHNSQHKTNKEQQRFEQQQEDQTEWEVYCSHLIEDKVLERGLQFVNYN